MSTCTAPLVRFAEADLSTATDRGQFDLWPNGRGGMGGV